MDREEKAPGEKTGRRATGILALSLSFVFCLVMSVPLLRLSEHGPAFVILLPAVAAGYLFGRRPSAVAAVAAYLLGPIPAAIVSNEFTFSGLIAEPVNVAAGVTVLVAGLLAGTIRELRKKIREAAKENERLGGELERSEERYHLAAKGSADGLWDWDLRTGTISCSERLRELLGYDRDDAVESQDSWFFRIHSEDRGRVRAEISKILNGRDSILSTEFRILHRKENYLRVFMRGAAVRDDAGKAVRMAGSVTDITGKAVKDPLTDLPNRFMLLERLDALRSDIRNEACACAVLSIGVDNFSLVNTGLGPLAGDEILGQVAARLKTCTGDGDMLGRTESGRFVMIIRNAASRETVGTIADRIRNEFLKPCTVRNREMMISVSVGIAINDPKHAAGADLLRDADMALDQAGRQGTGTAAVFNERMHAGVISRLSTESDLHLATERDQFILYYQPIAEIRTMRTVGAEALIRWKHPSLGVMSPDRFVFILEETGLIRQVGTWVLDRVCRQLADWKAAGLDGFYVSVNLSPLQLTDRKLPRIMKQILKETAVDPGRLTLEITETAIMEKSDTVLGTLANLHALGVKLSVDDFGTGFSSIENLRRLPIDTIKIDRSFTEGCVANRKDRAIVVNMIELARGLEIRVLAEGVETENQLGILEENGCDLIQGFYIGRPLPPESFAEAFLKRPVVSEPPD